MFSKKIIPVIAGLFLVSLSACDSGSSSSNANLGEPEQAAGPNFDINSLSAELDAIPIKLLTTQEADDLLFMREEEKLARDAYVLFYSQWNQKIFNNISQAEQAHMDALLLLINRYELIDPVVDDIKGYFPNIELQALYDALSALGSNSIIDALMAGAEIEEVDLIDLVVRYAETDNKDIQFIYDILMLGSRNHLRSFVSNLSKQGIDYQPKHLSEEEYKLIINSPMEKG